MASGTYNISTKNQYISGYVAWTQSNINSNTNTSYLTMEVYLRRTNTYSGAPTSITNVNLTRKFYVDSDTVYNTTERATITIPNNGDYVKVAEAGKTVYHNPDGSKNGMTIGFEMSAASGTTAFMVSRQDNVISLDSVPRASQLNYFALNISDDGNTVTLNLTTTKYLSSFTDNLVIGKDNYSITFNDVSSGTITLSQSQRETLYKMFGNNTSAWILGYIQTYNNDTLIGSSSVAYTNATLPEYSLSLSASAIDTVSTFNTYKNNSNDLIKYLSKPRVTFSASSSSGSTYGNGIGYSINGESKASPADYTIYEGKNIELVASDGRKSASQVISNTVVPYEYPTINCSVVRPSPTGSTADVTITGTYYNGYNLKISALLEKAIALRYTEAGGAQQTFTNFTINETTNGNIVSFTATGQLSGLSYQKGLSYIATITDRIGVTKVLKGELFSGKPPWNAYLDSNDENVFNVNGNMTLNNLPLHRFVELATDESYLFNANSSKIMYPLNIIIPAVGDFNIDTTNGFVYLPSGVNHIKIGGTIAGSGDTASRIKVYDRNTGTVVATSHILMQGAGSTYWKVAMPTEFIELDSTHSYFIYLECGGYNRGFYLNDGFSNDATRFWIEIID